MSIPSNTKKRMAAVVAMLSVGGAGLTAGFGGDGVRHLRSGMPDDRPSEVTASWLPGATSEAGAGLVARHSGWGRRALEWGWSASPAVAPDTARSVFVGDDASGSEKPHPNRRSHTITVGLPDYEGGRPPSMTRPTFDAGKPPTAEPGWTTTVDLGELPTVGAPSVDPGESGTLYPPTVGIS